ncbi:MAG: DNA primase [Candidatus Gastranaerophilales bacterium]|nr:DNA primase [Candidatus Gastranaerophilales bacterium]
MSTNKTYSEVIDEIRNRLDILDVVQSRVVLKKKGANYWGCCPFHGEKTPSFCVNIQKGIFKCFGCGEGGDAISFLMKINNQSFMEVIRDLAQQFNIELPETTGNSKQYAEEKQKIKDCLDKTCEFYNKNLLTLPEAKGALEYLENRGITKEIIEEYKLGYSPKGYFDLQKKLSSNFDKDILIKAGLIVKTEKGDLVDRFRHRIMIPIRDEAGAVIAFGARAIEVNQNPKYLNSPDTILYNKSRILYGIDIAKDKMLEDDYVVIMEGYFDVISAQSAGLKNTVASCGTALTVDHVRLIAKYSKSRKIYLSFDTDSAGLKATQRSTDVIKEAFAGLGNLKIFDQSYSGLSENKYTCEIRVIAPFDSKDPDEYIREFGIEQYKKYIKKAPLLLDFQIEQILKDFNNDFSPTDKLAMVKKIMPLIEEIPNSIVQNEYIKLLSDRMKVDEKALIREINRSRSVQNVVNKDFSGIVTKSSNICEKAQKNLLSLFLLGGTNLDNPYLVEIAKNVKFIDKNLIIIQQTIDKLLCQVNNDVEKLIQALYSEFAEDNKLKDIITDLIYIADSFKGLSEKDFNAVVQENKLKIEQYISDSEKRELASKYKNLNDKDIGSIDYQLQLRDMIRNKRKTGE